MQVQAIQCPVPAEAGPVVTTGTGWKRPTGTRISSGSIKIYFNALGYIGRYKTASFTVADGKTTVLSPTALAKNFVVTGFNVTPNANGTVTARWSPVPSSATQVNIGVPFNSTSSLIYGISPLNTEWTVSDRDRLSYCLSTVCRFSIQARTAAGDTLFTYATPTTTPNGAVPTRAAVGAVASLPTKAAGTGVTLIWTSHTPATCTLTSSRTFIRGAAKGTCTISATGLGTILAPSPRYNLTVV